MPPIKVYTESPINPAKASGVTPQTAAPADNVREDSSSQTSTAPEQHPAPGPTPTRTIAAQGPPPPQPGAVPRLPVATGALPSSSSSPPAPPPPHGNNNNSSSSNNNNTPPAPTPAPVPGPGLTSHIPGVNHPPQMAIPPLQQQQATMGSLHQRGTAPNSARTLGTGFAGPGGYRPQNVPASGSASGYVPSYQGGEGGGLGQTAAGNYSPYGGLGAGRRQQPQQRDEQEGEGFLGAAVKLAKAAGEKLSAAESEVWRRINGEER